MITHKISDYTYDAKITSIYDGDGKFEVLMTVKVDIGMNEILTRERIEGVRLFNVDTPEVRGEHKRAGIIVRDFVRAFMLGKDVILKTKKDKTGKYGRLLADVIVDDVDLAQLLLDKGYAKPYFGGKKQEWSMEEIDHILFN